MLLSNFISSKLAILTPLFCATSRRRRFVRCRNVDEAERLSALYLEDGAAGKKEFCSEGYNRLRPSISVIVLETNLGKPAHDV